MSCLHQKKNLNCDYIKELNSADSILNIGKFCEGKEAYIKLLQKYSSCKDSTNFNDFYRIESLIESIDLYVNNTGNCNVSVDTLLIDPLKIEVPVK